MHGSRSSFPLVSIPVASGLGTRAGGRACRACASFHDPLVKCPGELPATGPERHGWRVVVDTPSGVEAYGVLIAESHDAWRARILTFPNVLWLAPGTQSTLKFVGRTPQEAEAKAIAYIDAHCARRKYLRRDGLALVDGAVIPSEGTVTRATPQEMWNAVRDVRKLHVVPLRFGTKLPMLLGQTINVSLGGMCIGTASPLSPGLQLIVSVELGIQSISLAGRVVWNRIHQEPGRPLGMGVYLLDPPDDYRTLVERLP